MPVSTPPDSYNNQSTNYGPTSGQGNQFTQGDTVTYGEAAAAAGATQLNLEGSSGAVVSVSSALADADLEQTATQAMGQEAATAQQAEEENYNLASLVTQSNPGIAGETIATQANKQNFQFLATSIFALAALAGWWVYRGGLK